MKDEVKEALFQLNPSKAPSLGGFLVVFPQKHLASVQDKVFAVCLYFLNEWGNLLNLNKTLIALIPEVDNPRKVTNFRPISLHNVIYKIIAKNVANRMKPFLNQILSFFKTQRLITNSL